jgi:hypothetical protein
MVLKHAKDDVLIFAPAARGLAAKLSAQSVRANAADLARSTHRAVALRIAGKAAGIPQNYSRFDGQVFVNLEPHALRSSGRSIVPSRASSAA